MTLSFGILLFLNIIQQKLIEDIRLIDVLAFICISLTIKPQLFSEAHVKHKRKYAKG